jgi:hypothetical protein
MGTDSAHFLVKHKRFEANVDENLKVKFSALYDNHFETGDKISGIWVEEGFFNSGEYIGEKSFTLSNENHTPTHMKGLNSMFQKKFVDKNFAIYKTYMNKNLFSNYVGTFKKIFCICCW